MSAGTVTLVVIGRNAAEQLRRHWSDVPSFGECERIYADSASTDGSAEVASALGFKVARLDGSAVLSAAAGRHAGAAVARGEWILFLDSDMELRLEKPLSEIVDALEKENWIGAAGDTFDALRSGERRRTRRDVPGGEAAHFGGFVLLNRRALLDAGNYNPAVVANEELELHARLKARGQRVRYAPEFSCLHFPEGGSRLSELLGVYLPVVRRTRARYGALGMAARAAANAGSLRQLVRLAPEPFLFPAAAIVAVTLALVSVPATAACVLLFALFCLRRHGLGYLAAVPGISIQLVAGWFRYRERPCRWTVDEEAP
ncbi:MAG: glycosyltransferase [Fibrobacterales bacterium]|nr:glycosyltransferase [Fibrobacterales bacterium]